MPTVRDKCGLLVMVPTLLIGHNDGWVASPAEGVGREMGLTISSIVRKRMYLMFATSPIVLWVGARGGLCSGTILLLWDEYTAVC